MKRILLIVNIVVGSAILTLMICVGSLLVMMFTGDNSGDVHRTGLFGALEFRSVEGSDGAVDLTLGVTDPVPVLVVFLATALWLTLVRGTYRFLTKRRAALIAQRARAGQDVS